MHVVTSFPSKLHARDKTMLLGLLKRFRHQERKKKLFKDISQHLYTFKYDLHEHCIMLTVSLTCHMLFGVISWAHDFMPLSYKMTKGRKTLMRFAALDRPPTRIART